ncbi:MAG: FlgD immunoglobulin-like domain containing protein [Candidatus Eisenbacteria bacterium]
MRLATCLTVLLAGFATPAFAAPPRALFDNTHAETAGNADWIIDADQPEPIPAQATVTPATPRTYWLGGISSWGIDLVKRGYQVSTLTTAFGITYGNAGNAYDLSNFDVFIMPEPNTLFSRAESTAIFNYVSDGGGLVVVVDHMNSDRNNDGWDSPRILNALGIQQAWGIRCAVTGDANNSISQDSGNYTSDSADPIVNGPNGKADSLSFHGGDTFILYPANNPSVRGTFWMTGNAQSSTVNVMAARLTYGAGRVFIVGDSSPADDGSAQAGNSSIYDGWGEVSGRDSLVFLNATQWVTRQSDVTPPSVVVVSPDGGEQWDAGASYPVTWSASDASGVDSVTIAYSLHDSFGPWVEIARAVANTGSYPWTTPFAYSDSGLVRVTAYDHLRNSAVDLSNARFTLGASSLGADDVAAKLALARVWPNPSRGALTLRFRLPLTTRAQVQLLDLAGRVVWSRDFATMPAGEHDVAWDGRDAAGRAVPAGLYFAQLVTPVGSKLQRVVRIP